MKKILKRLLYFFKTGIWSVKTKGQPFYFRWGINTLKTLILSFKGFRKDECPIRASALTYFTLLSVVPVIAVAFAIAKGFGLEQLLEEEIAKALASQKEVLTYLLEFSKKMLSTTKGGLLAVISIGFLLYTVLKLFHHIESAVNKILDIKKSRTFLRKFTDYLTIVMIAPILMIASSAATVFIQAIVTDLTKDSILTVVSPILFSALKLIPFVIMWILFTLMYMIMPNAKVKFKQTFIAGLVAGTAFQFIQIYYIDVQSAFSRYNAIYGSFAALPLFLFWVQFSWLVFLFGAEISAAIGNINSFGFKQEYDHLSFTKKKLLALLFLKKITSKFKEGDTAPSTQQLADDLKLPVQYANKISTELIAAGLINKIIGSKNKKSGFQPAKDIAQLSFSEAIKRIENIGDNRLAIYNDDDFKRLNEQLEGFSKLVKANYSQLMIKDI